MSLFDKQYSPECGHCQYNKCTSSICKRLKNLQPGTSVSLRVYGVRVPTSGSLVLQSFDPTDCCATFDAGGGVSPFIIDCHRIDGFTINA
ncbi:hypothetical protein [Guptibacillus algicola]|uniref:hypothetical protein n=1 Tax=Guptibacillus algicola TaxID=225844 RepID=UPI001CD1B4DC|nr:hypothetical protein [Alkalihalobacillus algicola]MCA0987394.1 hypothetical protein [Alkalihalobacillus algicola]